MAQSRLRPHAEPAMASKPGAQAGFWRGDEDSPLHAAGCWGGPAPRTHSRHVPLTVLKAKPLPRGGRRPGTRWAASGPASCWSPLRTGSRQTLQKVFRADSPGDGLVGHGPGAPALAGTFSPSFTGLPCQSSGFPSSHRQADHEPCLAPEPAHLHKLRGRAEAGGRGGTGALRVPQSEAPHISSLLPLPWGWDFPVSLSE